MFVTSSNSMPRRRMLAALALCSLVFGGASGVHAQQTEKKADRPERPPQDAVLASNSVLTANVPYGDDPLQRLDVYAPRDAKQAPIVIFVHGGEWTRGDKAAVSYKPKFFNQNGIVFASVNYRLAPAAVHPAIANDVATAIGWVRDHAAQFGGDPKKIVLMGHSAGCHLVTLVGLDPRYLSKAGMRPADLAGVVAWSGGSYDLVQKVEQGGAYADYIKKAFGDSPDTWRDASPVTHAAQGKGGPGFLFVSIEPGNASHQAAERLATLIREGGGKSATKMLEGRDHFGANHLLGSPDDSTGAIFLQFVQEVTK